MNDYIFVSHSSRDGDSVRQLVDHLESAGVRCWVSYRDIPPGADWAETIYDAIEGSRGMLLVLSRQSNNSRQIRNELDIATNLKKTIVPVKLQDIELSKGIRYFTNSHQWLDATGGWKEIFPRLLGSLAELLERDIDLTEARAPGKSCRRIWTTVTLLLVLTFVTVGLVSFLGNAPDDAGTEGLVNLIAGQSDTWDYATDITALSGGGFISTGTWDWGFWSEWWVGRFDADGRILWTWSDSLSGEDKPLLLPASGGDVICAAGGYSDFDHTGFPVRALRFDSSGTILWDNSWWFEWNGAVQPEMAAMEMTADSLIYLFFTLRQLSSQSIRANQQVVITSAGEFVRRDTLGESNEARELLVLRNGNILRVFKDLPSRANGIEIVSVEEEVLDRIVIGDARSFVTCGVEMPDGHLLLFMTRDTYGQGKGDLAVLGFSPDLELQWEKEYGGAMPESMYEALPLPSGNIILAGYTSSFGDGSRDAWLMELDGQGEQVWESVVDTGGSDRLNAVSLKEDGGLWAAGVTSRYGQPDAWILSFGPRGRWNPDPVLGLDLFSEDWEKGFIDQTVWEMGFNRNYTPVLHSDSAGGGYSFDANNVPVVTMHDFPLVPGLTLSAEVTVPDMPGAGGSNWLAVGMTRSDTDHFHLDPGMVSDMEFRWTYTPGINDQSRELLTKCGLAATGATCSRPDSLWLERGVPQRLTIETCSRTVRFWVNDSLFHEDSVRLCPEVDSVRVYLWGSSSSLPHHLDDLRLYRRRW